MKTFNHLSLSWSTSRGRDTYGYNIARLDSHNTATRYRCNGGGYDMVGTVFARFLEAEHQTELQAFFDAHQSELVASYGGYWKHPKFYGAHVDMDSRRVRLDGACGLESMERIAEACGLTVSRDVNRRGNIAGFFVTSGAENV